MAKRNRFAQQAALDALVRFGPELRGLEALVAQAYSNRTQGMQVATGTARSTTSAIDAARPGTKKIYEDAGLRQAKTATLLSNDLAAIPGADSIKAGAAVEQAGFKSRLGDAQAAALADLDRQRVAAQSGKQFAMQNTQREFVSELAKVLQQRQGVLQEQGAFTASETGKLRQSALDRQTRLDIENAGNQQSERNSLRSAGIDPDTGRPIAGGKLDPRATSKLKPDKSFNKDVGSAIGALQSALDPDKALGRSKASQALVNGAPALTKKTKNKDGLVETQTLAGAIKPHDALAVRVVNDIYYDGHLSPQTLKLLRRSGIDWRAIPGAARWSKAQRAAQKRKRESTFTVGTSKPVTANLGR